MYICTVKDNKSSKPLIETVDPRLCYNGKIRRLSRMVTQIYEAEMKEFDLRSSQFGILMMVGKMGNTNQKTMADYLFMDQSTMSRDLNKLIARGLISQSKASDARHSEIQLTKEGIKLLDRVIPVWKSIHEKVEKTIGSYSSSHLDTLTAGLRQMLEKG
jgi:DNA-binding MarR family transcriptional regulator